MRNAGPALIIGGAFGVAVAMFFPVYRFGGEEWTWWEYLDGLDIAMLTASVLAASLALGAAITDRMGLRQMSAIAGAVTFGLAFEGVPSAIDDSYFFGYGLWLVAAAGGVALAGAVITALSGARQPAQRGPSSRWRLASIAITAVGVIAVAAMAIADPFGGPSAQATGQVLGVNDAAKLTRTWAAEHKRSGEKFVQEGCTGDGAAFEARWACHVRFEPTGRVITVYVRTTGHGDKHKVVQVRSGRHPLPYP